MEKEKIEPEGSASTAISTGTATGTSDTTASPSSNNPRDGTQQDDESQTQSGTVQRVIVAEEDPLHVQEARVRQGALSENVIADHLERYLQAADNKDNNTVYSAIFGGPHVYSFAPSAILGRNYTTLVTMGMSGTRMKVPAEIEAEEPGRWCRAELVCFCKLRIRHDTDSCR